MTGEVPHHGISETFSIGFDHPTDDVNFSTGLGCLNAPHHGCLGALHQ